MKRIEKYLRDHASPMAVLYLGLIAAAVFLSH